MTDTNNLKQQVLHSLKWVALGKIGTQIIRWLMTFWVIRLLMPEDYGFVAMADVFFGFLTLMIGSLFAPSIIQNKELSQQSLKQIFGMVLMVYSLFFALQLLLADTIGSYYQSDVVASILKVNAWCFLILALEVIPAALLARDMEFKKVSIISAIANITAAISTLILAYLGYGFWALIIGEIVSITLRTAMTLVIKPINFLPSFKISEIKPMLAFGGVLSGHAILIYFFLHMDVAIAGRHMSAIEVGLFAVGLQFALMPQKKILPILRQVAFPAFSKIQDQPERISAYILKAQKLSLLITIPIFWGLASVVDLIIPLILGEKWTAAVLPTMIILLVMPLRFCEELFMPALKSQRKVNHMIVNTLIMLVIMFVAIMFGVNYGAVGLASAWALGFPISFVIVVNRNCRLFLIAKLSILKLFLVPSIAGILMMLSILFTKQYLMEVSVIHLLSQIIVGALVFVMTLLVMDRRSILEIKNLVQSKR